MVCLMYARMAVTPRILWYYGFGFSPYGLVAPSVEIIDRWRTREANTRSRLPGWTAALIGLSV
jgi:hypothetical protein